MRSKEKGLVIKMNDETSEKEFLEKLNQDKNRKQNLSIELETVGDDELIKLIEEILNDPLFL